MDSLVYLVRSPMEQISPFLYSQDNGATVVVVEKPPLAGRVVKSAPGFSKESGTTLSYGDLLELLIESRRIIAL